MQEKAQGMVTNRGRSHGANLRVVTMRTGTKTLITTARAIARARARRELVRSDLG